MVLGIFIGSFYKVPYKYLIRSYFGEEFARYVYLCDSAMREHYIAKNQLLQKMNEDSNTLLGSTEIALLDCHEYDKLRKKLIILGLNEADLSLISLNYIEKKSDDLIEVIKTHEIKD